MCLFFHLILINTQQSLILNNGNKRNNVFLSTLLTGTLFVARRKFPINVKFLNILFLKTKQKNDKRKV